MREPCSPVITARKHRRSLDNNNITEDNTSPRNVYTGTPEKSKALELQDFFVNKNEAKEIAELRKRICFYMLKKYSTQEQSPPSHAIC